MVRKDVPCILNCFMCTLRLSVHIQMIWEKTSQFVFLVEKLTLISLNRHLNPKPLRSRELAVLVLCSQVTLVLTFQYALQAAWRRMTAEHSAALTAGHRLLRISLSPCTIM